MSLNNIDWEHELYQLSTEIYLPLAINIIAEKCMLQKENNFKVSSEENPHEKET